MPKKKRPSAIQPSLFPTDEITSDQDSAPIEVEPLEPGDVVLVDGDRARHWIVIRVLADHVSIWNDSEADCVERSRVARLGKMPGLVKGYANGWLAKLIHSLGYWEVLELIGERQPKTAKTKDQLHFVRVNYSNSTARHSDTWQLYDSDLKQVENLVDQFIEWCRDAEIPMDQALAAVFERYFEVREK